MNPEEVLRFWFAGVDPEGPAPEAKLKLWFGGDISTDGLIRSRFAAAVAEAFCGRLDRWAQTPRGRLALILLLDQFPRNIFRGKAAAYAGDPLAVRLCLEGLARGEDRQLSVAEKAFFYLPLEHAEEKSLQGRSVALFTSLLEQASPRLRPQCRGFLSYAERHREIILRFGRFPHRNRALGRLSTAAEKAFLRQPNSSF